VERNSRGKKLLFKLLKIFTNASFPRLFQGSQTPLKSAEKAPKAPSLGARKKMKAPLLLNLWNLASARAKWLPAPTNWLKNAYIHATSVYGRVATG
jgi:hypothetical protein